jgi:hypothetical protein
MLWRLSLGVYWLTSIFALALIITAAALAVDIGKSDGFELYAVAAMLAAAGLVVWFFGRAILSMNGRKRQQ